MVHRLSGPCRPGQGDQGDQGELVVVETPHVTVAWDGLEEVKQLSSSLGQILSSSCIPAVSTVGKPSSQLICLEKSLDSIEGVE